LKRSQLLAISVVALIALSAFPAQVARAQGGYTEKLSVYVAGSDSLWFFTFGGINGSGSLSSLESTPGLSWYNITAVDTTAWTADYQIFGPYGYGILPAPFVPTQGLFFTVGSDSYADAASAASSIDSYLLTTFTSLSNGTGVYTFYSPISFGSVVPTTLYNFVPTGEQGFTNVLSSAGFTSSDSPFIVLEGQSGSSGFDHSLVIGSISSSALTAAFTPNLLSYFGGSPKSLAASNHSTSSVIRLTALDGIIKSNDSATLTTDTSLFTGSYTLPLSPGEHVSKLNATIVQQPPQLLASRAVDVGVLRTNGNISVTLSLKNLSPSNTITVKSFTDSWWNGTGLFKFLGGDENVTNASLAPGSTITPVYRLQFTGTSSGSVTLPASAIRYQYKVGGVTFDAAAVLNPIRLSLNADDAVVYALLSPIGGFGKAVGASQSLNLTLVNVGTLPASSVVAAGRQVAGLAARSGNLPGGTATLTLTQSAAGFTGINVTEGYPVTYQNPSGTSLATSSNVVSDIFSHTSIQAGWPVVSVTDQLSALPNGRTNLTLTYAVENQAPAKVTSFNGTGSLPAALGCGTVRGKGINCTGDTVTLTFLALDSSTTTKDYMTYNLSTSANFIIPPMTFEAINDGLTMTGMSNAVAAPAGLSLSKQFTPAQLFEGMASQVQVVATNHGPQSLYSATVSSTVDPFDTLAGVSSQTKTVSSVAPGGNVTFSYGVTTSEVYGNLTSSAVSASFFFGGTSFTLSGGTSKVNIYQPLGVSISTNPVSPEEGKNFTIKFQITNPSGVQVNDVTFTLPVPSGLALSGLQNAHESSGVLIVTAGSLAAHSTATASAEAVASSGITIPFAKAKLTFSYQGATINGTVPSKSGIAIAENVTTRYLIPTAFVLVVLLVTAVYLRRKAATSPSSPQ
jgi:hypothetical protein